MTHVIGEKNKQKNEMVFLLKIMPTNLLAYFLRLYDMTFGQKQAENEIKRIRLND